MAGGEDPIADGVLASKPCAGSTAKSGLWAWTRMNSEGAKYKSVTATKAPFRGPMRWESAAGFYYLTAVAVGLTLVAVG